MNINRNVFQAALLAAIMGLASQCRADCPEVSKWSAEGNANDSIGANNGTLMGGVTFATGKVGQAFSLPYGAYINVPHSATLDPLTSFTWQAWIPRGSPYSGHRGSLKIRPTKKTLFGAMVP